MANKSLAVAKYILNKQKSITSVKLLKLAYIAHGMTLGVLGRALLDENVEAWPYGPVVRSIYHAVAGQGSRQIEKIDNVPDNWENMIHNDEKRILDYVCDKYGNISAYTLSDATHKEGTPWDITMKTTGGYYPSISDNLIEDFYRKMVIGKEHNKL